jgi:HAE1 family hydrophobic/amphiphilic exporter-1
MKNLAKYSVDRAITIFMAVLIVMVFGVVSYTNLTTDLFPSMNLPYSVVITTYIGASPEEVEDVVTNPLEDALATTSNIKELSSVSQENMSMIIMEFNSDTNMDSAVIEMRETLDRATVNMPDMVGSPMIIKLNPDMMPIMQMSVSKGDLGQEELTQYVYDEIIPNLERVPGVASVSVSGAYESEVQVLLNDTDLAAKNVEIVAINAQFVQLWEDQGLEGEDAPQLPLLDRSLISDILMAQNFEFPLGYANILDNDPDVVSGTYLVRVGEEFDSTDEISDLLVFTFSGMPNAAYDPLDPASEFWSVNPLSITMDEISEIDFINANEKEYSKVNGNNAISLTIQKSSEFATTDVTEAISEAIGEISETDTDTVFTVLLDQGEYIELATGSVVNNLLYGAILAVIVLIVFLRSARATFIVAISIPISLLFAVALIYFSGITLNIVSLGGLALGIGMLVDNSIVVMENIFRLKKQGFSNREAAIQGTKQVAGAIFASTITTISVFVPVIFIEGFIKEIFMQMALTIAFSLIASLLIALTLVPAISSRILKEDSKEKVGESKKLDKFKKGYEKVFNFAFKFKYLVILLVLALFGGSIWLALSNGFEYFPTSDEGQLSISIDNPVENPLSTDDFFDVLDDITDDILLIDDVDVVGVTLGSMQGQFMGFSSSNSASASVVLKENRDLTTQEIQLLLEEIMTDDYSQVEYSISGSQQQTAMLTGSGYQVEIRGHELDTLKLQAETLAAEFRTVEGVLEVDDGVGIPADEIRITVNKDDAIRYGYLTAVVGGMIAEKLAGEDLTTTITQDGTMYDIYVYDSYSNFSGTSYTFDEIKDLVLGQSMFGTDVKISDVATVEMVEGFSSISHTNGVRSITVSVEFDPEFNSSFVAKDLDVVMEDYEVPSGFDFEIQGENEEIMGAMETLALALVLGVALIYMIMASQFQSLKYPLIIMFTIPLAFTGGFLALFFTGMPVSVVAMIGFLILVGVVVNNGIVLVDYTNQLRKEGMHVKEALLEAGKTRLRPIIMTALTTILALLTMAIGVGNGAEMMQPMAVATIGGLLYATILTLVLVPIMYFLFNKKPKQVLSVLAIVILVGATVGGYMYLSLWYIILIGAVLTLGVIANWVFNKKKVA